MKTSLIIPFRNEVGYAEATLSGAYQFLSERNLEFELIAVDDSSDGTWEIAQAFAAQHENVVAIKGGSPPGYGKALRTGFHAASGDILIPFNGDLSDSLDDVANSGSLERLLTSELMWLKLMRGEFARRVAEGEALRRRPIYRDPADDRAEATNKTPDHVSKECSARLTPHCVKVQTNAKAQGVRRNVHQ